MPELNVDEIKERYMYVMARKPATARHRYPQPELDNLLATIPDLVIEIRELRRELAFQKSLVGSLTNIEKPQV